MPSTSCTLPFKMKKDMIEAYLLMERSQEEQELLTTEMRNALDFWNSCAKNLQESVDSMRSKTDLYSCGAASILQQHLWIIDFTCSGAEAAFQTVLVTDDHSLQYKLHYMKVTFQTVNQTLIAALCMQMISSITNFVCMPGSILKSS